MNRVASASGIALSVVVPTHNRSASVFRLLRALRSDLMHTSALQPADVEVIIVSDGSPDDTVHRLQASIDARDWPFELRITAHDTAQGPGIARNSGAANARGTTLLFIDDDIEPFLGALALHHRMHADATERGEVLVVIGAPVPLRKPVDSLEHISAWGWWEQQFERMSRPGHRFTYDEVFTGILSMPRATFETVGRFDSSLGGCHEDSELGLRLFRAGARAEFSRAAGGVHHEVRDTARLLPRKFDEGRADVQLLQRWPELTMVVRATDRLPPLRTADGLLRRNAMNGGWLADAVPRIAMPVLQQLDRWRLRLTWRRVHSALLWHCYWRGVAADVGSWRAHEQLQSDCADALIRWQADAHHVRLDLADGLDTAALQLDALRPDAVTVHLGPDDIGEIDAIPGAERLHGGHLRRLLATSFSKSLTMALALHELRSRAALHALSITDESDTAQIDAAVASAPFVSQAHGARRQLTEPAHPDAPC